MNNELHITLSFTESEIEQATSHRNPEGFIAYLEEQLSQTLRSFVLHQFAGLLWEYRQVVCPHPTSALKVIICNDGQEKLLCPRCGAEFDDDPHAPDSWLEMQYEDRYFIGDGE